MKTAKNISKLEHAYLTILPSEIKTTIISKMSAKEFADWDEAEVIKIINKKT